MALAVLRRWTGGKPVVAFLNSDGGDIVIGAVEEAKFHGPPQERLVQNFPAIGGMRLVGITHDYQFLKERSWDGYQRKILDAMADRIGASVSGLVRVRRVMAPFEQGDDVELCVVSVSPLLGDLAFLDKDCFVRSGASTRQIKGADLLKYESRRGAKAVTKGRRNKKLDE